MICDHLICQGNTCRVHVVLPRDGERSRAEGDTRAEVASREGISRTLRSITPKCGESARETDAVEKMVESVPGTSREGPAGGLEWKEDHDPSPSAPLASSRSSSMMLITDSVDRPLASLLHPAEVSERRVLTAVFERLEAEEAMGVGSFGRPSIGRGQQPGLVELAAQVLDDRIGPGDASHLRRRLVEQAPGLILHGRRACMAEMAQEYRTHADRAPRHPWISSTVFTSSAAPPRRAANRMMPRW